MKKITTKKILEEYGYLTANLKMIKKNNIPEIKKKFSFLHFNEAHFSETYIKSDEKEFWKLIFFISKTLTNAKAHLKTDIVEKCLQKNMNFYLFAAEMCDDEGEMPAQWKFLGGETFYPIIYFRIAINNTALVVASFTNPKPCAGCSKIIKN